MEKSDLILRSMEKVILTDVDGVLLDWGGGFEAFMGKRRPELLEQGPCAPFIGQNRLYQWLGLSSFEEAMPIVSQFYGSEYDYQMKAFPDALKYISRLHQEGWRIIAISHSVDLEKSYDVKLQCLRRNFGDVFEDLHSIYIHECKSTYLKKYAPTFWVEDALKNAIAGARLGYKPFLMFREEWGEIPDGMKQGLQTEIPVDGQKDFRKLKLVKNWEEIYASIHSKDADLEDVMELASSM